MASVLASGGIVVAFEPSRANRSYLERHVALNGLNGSIRIEGVLVGDAIRDAVPFFEFDEAAGRNTTIAGVLSTNVQRRMVAQVSLDEYCVRAGLSPDVIKIDVEGAEIDVLLGAKRLLAISRPVIFLSVHPRQIQAAGRKLEELTAVISSAGYDCWHMDGSSVSEYGLREYILRPVAVPGSVANEE
jgi:FkbM family methyltransferase